VAEPIVFYFDFSSPYSYLASEKIDALAARYGRQVIWRPVLLGVIFQHWGTVSLVRQSGQEDYAPHDMARSARFMGIPFRFPSRFPLPTQQAARAFYWLQDHDADEAKRFAHQIFRAFYVDDRDISAPATVLDIATAIGVDKNALSVALGAAELKNRFRRETDAAIKLGVFGAPWIMVDAEAFWGADRLPQIEKWLETGGF
jgi:2-hydroxychromene-2-carboxylate isomerase